MTFENYKNKVLPYISDIGYIIHPNITKNDNGNYLYNDKDGYINILFKQYHYKPGGFIFFQKCFNKNPSYENTHNENFDDFDDFKIFIDKFHNKNIRKIKLNNLKCF